MAPGTARHRAPGGACTTTCTTSSGAAASTRTSSTSRRSPPRRPSSSATAASARPCSRPGACASSARSRRARAAAPGAGWRSTPTASARSCSRWRTSAARFRLLEERGGTPITDVEGFATRAAPPHLQHHDAASATRRSASSSGAGYRALYPGMAVHPRPEGGHNRFGFGMMDHVTANFQTMKPALLWMEHVLGFEEFWEVAVPHRRRGRASAPRKATEGLRAALHRDARPESGREVREQRAVAARLQELADQHLPRGTARGRHPARGADGGGHPRRGAGDARARASSSCRRPAPTTTCSPSGWRRSAIGKIDEDVETLRELDILVDGAGPRRYMLQIFLQGLGRPVRRPGRGAVLLRDHPAQGRPGVRRRQLPRALRVASSASSSARRRALAGVRCSSGSCRAARSRGSTTSPFATRRAGCATRSA